MEYVMFVRVDPELAEAMTEAERGDPAEWDREGRERGLRVTGGVFEDGDTATTVRVRDGRTLLADGPFVETKEIVCGFDRLDAPDLETAVDYASRHPVARFGAIEIRRAWDDFAATGEEAAPVRDDGAEYMFLHVPTSDGGTPPDEPEASLIDWIQDVERRGVTLGGTRLADADASAAATVRVRAGETLVTRGPFAELAEQIAGVDLIRVADLDEAIAIAAAHPTSRYGVIEVRPVRSLG